MNNIKEQLEQQYMAGNVEDRLIIEAEGLLDERQYNIYQQQINNNTRSLGIAYVIWFFLSILQLHMFYLNIFDKAHLKLLRITGLVLLYFGIGLFILVPLAIYDAVKMPEYLRDFQRNKKTEILLILFKKQQD